MEEDKKENFQTIENDDGYDDLFFGLLAKDLKVKSKDEKGRTALHLAMCFEDNEMVEVLINIMKRNVGALEENLVDDEGLSYLHILCTINDPDLVLRVLKSSPASITSAVNANSKKWPGYTALHFAIEYERSAIVKLLLENGAMDSTCTYNAKLMYSLEMTCSLPADGIQRLTLRERRDEACNNLEESVLNERKKILDQLLKYEKDASRKESALICALENASMTFRDLSMYFGRSEASDTNEELEQAQIELVLKLLKAGAPITSNVYILATKLVMQREDIYLLEELLDSGANPNFTFEGGETFLHKVCNDLEERDESFYPNITNCLLNYGARSDVADCQLATPLHNLAKVGCYQSAEVLLNHSCENSKEKEICLESRFNVDAQDELGNTPLHYAITKKNHILKELLPFGCDFNVENDEGLTALSLFCQNKKYYCEERSIFREIKMYLLKLQAADCFVSKKIREQVAELVTTIGYREDEIVQNDLMEEYNLEVDRLKDVRIDSRLNLHSLLVSNIDNIAYCTNNEELKVILEAWNFKKKFPNYAQLLRSRFVRAAQRKTLLDQARLLTIASNRVQLPSDCSSKIFQFLDDNSLRKVIRSAELSIGSSTGPQPKRNNRADEEESDCRVSSKRHKLL